ncbi:hypothetical protein GQ53DRAFT_99731 [Thozetella sp. PMI_491]|nr:hypothetical protein GQ53DRAFT_99731 [Thozetella sp. PMI_491]
MRGHPRAVQSIELLRCQSRGAYKVCPGPLLDIPPEKGYRPSWGRQGDCMDLAGPGEEPSRAEGSCRGLRLRRPTLHRSPQSPPHAPRTGRRLRQSQWRRCLPRIEMMAPHSRPQIGCQGRGPWQRPEGRLLCLFRPLHHAGEQAFWQKEYHPSRAPGWRVAAWGLRRGVGARECRGWLPSRLNRHIDLRQDLTGVRPAVLCGNE